MIKILVNSVAGYVKSDRYVEVMTEKTGKRIGYFFIAMIVITLLCAGIPLKSVTGEIRDTVNSAVDELKMLEYNNGELSADSASISDNGVFLEVNTDRDAYTEDDVMEKYRSGFETVVLMGKLQGAIMANGTVKSFKYREFLDAMGISSFNKTIVKGWIESFAKLVYGVSVGVTVLSYILYALAAAFAVACVGRILYSSFRKKLTFSFFYSLSLVIEVPLMIPLILNDMFGWLRTGSGVVFWFVYAVVSFRAMKSVMEDVKKKETEPQVFDQEV